jgi:hypothetical protein
VVVAVWIHDQGLEWFRRRFAPFSERVRRHPASVAIDRGLERGARMLQSR